MISRFVDPKLVVVYAVAFITGAIVMSFEMLGSRYLNPFFGSGIYTWASLISTILAALTTGYFCGGWLADRMPTMPVLGAMVVIGSAYLIVLPFFADFVLETILFSIQDIKLGSLISAFAIMFPPVVFLGMYSPFAIRLLLRSTQQSGSTSGAVYGISTFGSIVGTLGTTFFLMPIAGSRVLTISLGVAGIAGGFILMLIRDRKSVHSAVAVILLIGASALCPQTAKASEILDSRARSAVLALKDGLIANLETEYNNIFINKRRQYVVMSFRRYSESYTESASNLNDPDDLPIEYTQAMTVGVLYPDDPRKCLMIGLGGGSLSTYLARYFPDMAIDNVELDPGVISAAKRYFGIRETEKIRLIESDGRVFLNRNSDRYDLVLVDAFRGGYVPFHLLTKEFYTLLQQRLNPTGVAVFNIHSGTKLYTSTLLTLRSVFPAIDLYAEGGSVIAVVSNGTGLDAAALARRAAALQERIGFRYPMPRLLENRIQWPQTANAELLTDDFSPVNLYESIQEGNKRKW
ncbi:MAG: fused MFS/spermidine synthase [Xanthobacteraceae bacterium]